jgi:colanic acid biosynthesis glycosyl transferase WcaI
MKVLVIGLNYSPEEIGIGPYTGGMCEHLVQHGHSVRVVTAKPYYPQWKVSQGYSPWTWDSESHPRLSITRVPLFVPANPSGLKRLIHYFSFSITALPIVVRSALSFKPNIVVCVAPSLVSAPLAGIASTLARCPAILHVQDLEVGAAFATGLLKRRSIIGRMAIYFERKVLNMFQYVSSISPAMIETLAELGISREKLILFRNWSDTQRIFPSPSSENYRSAWNIGSRKVALYSGNIGKKQGIEIIINAAERLRARTDLVFVICGVGPFRAALEARAAGLENVQFHDLQPVARLNELLSVATVHLLPQSAEAADLVLPSKMVNMLASGRPIVATALPETALAMELDGCGLAVPPEDTVAFADAVEKIIDSAGLYDQMAAAARAKAESVWSKPVILDRWRTKLERIATHSNDTYQDTDLDLETR